MAKLRVSLDTSVLRKDPKFSGGAFEALARFAEAGYAEILLPQVVVDEFTTLPSSKTESLAALKRTLKDLRRKTPDDLHETITIFETSIAAEFEKIENAAAAALQQWLKRVSATVEPTRPDHGARVIKRYFAGDPPFRSAKAREDFPDAFIFEVLSDLAAEGGGILIVAADKRLAAAATELPSATVFASLKDLLESEDFEDIRSEIEVENVDRVIDAIRENKHLFQHAIATDIVDAVAGKFVWYQDPYADEKEGAENLYIETVSVVLGWDLGNDVDYLGEGVISIDFTATVEITVDASPGDYFYDDQYESSAERTVEVDGALSIQMDANQLKEPSLDWSGVKVLNLAQLSVDEVFNIELSD